MRIIALTSAVALALGAAACNRPDNDSDVVTDANLVEDNATAEVLGNETADAALPTTGAEFAAAVAASDMYEIEAGKLARQKGASADVKAIGGTLVTDHTKSTSDLKAAAGQAKVTVAPALDAEKQSLLDQLKAASGAEFDRLFLSQQKTAHEKALKLLQNYSSSGDSDPLKSFAGKATAVVQGHLDHLSRIKL